MKLKNKYKNFSVEFTDGTYKAQSVHIEGEYNADQAVILAKAKRIQQGKDYTFHSIKVTG